MGRGISHPWRGSEAERKGRSAAEVCTSEARKTAGNPLRRAIGAEPLSEACLPYCVPKARQIAGSALWAGTGPLEVGAKTRMRLKRGRKPPPGKNLSRVLDDLGKMSGSIRCLFDQFVVAEAFQQCESVSRA